MPHLAGGQGLAQCGGEVPAGKMGYSASTVSEVGHLFLKIDTLEPQKEGQCISNSGLAFYHHASITNS